MFLVELGNKAVLAENLFVVSPGDSNKINEFGLDLGVPVFVIVQQLRVEVVTEQGAAGRSDVASLVGFDSEDIAGFFVSVQVFH